MFTDEASWIVLLPILLKALSRLFVIVKSLPAAVPTIAALPVVVLAIKELSIMMILLPDWIKIKASPVLVIDLKVASVKNVSSAEVR